MKLDVWTKQDEVEPLPEVGHNPPPSKEEKDFAGVMDDILKRQTAVATANVSEAAKGEKSLIDMSRWNAEIAFLTSESRFRPFKRGGDAAMADLFKVRKQFRVAEWIEAPEVLEALRQEGFEFARTVNDTTADDLQTALMEGMKKGETIVQIERRIVAVNEAWRDGRRSLMIARTEIARAFTGGQIEAWKQSGVVTEKKWSAVGDACIFCLDMDGKVIEVESSFFDEGDILTVDRGGGKTASLTMGSGNVKGPPLHPNCRCAIVAHIVVPH